MCNRGGQPAAASRMKEYYGRAPPTLTRLRMRGSMISDAAWPERIRRAMPMMSGRICS